MGTALYFAPANRKSIGKYDIPSNVFTNINVIPTAAPDYYFWGCSIVSTVVYFAPYVRDLPPLSEHASTSRVRRECAAAAPYMMTPTRQMCVLVGLGVALGCGQMDE